MGEPVLGVDDARQMLRSEVNHIQAKLEKDSLPGVTKKLTVGAADIYITLGHYRRRLVRIEIVPDKNGERVELDNERGNVQVAADMASLLLASGLWTKEDLVREWRGTRNDATRVYPCSQVGGVGVGGALDAVARWMEQEQ